MEPVRPAADQEQEEEWVEVEEEDEWEERDPERGLEVSACVLHAARR